MKKLLCVLLFGMVFGQAKLETRVYEISINQMTQETPLLLDLDSITGYNLDIADVAMYHIDIIQMYGNHWNHTLNVQHKYIDSDANEKWDSAGFNDISIYDGINYKGNIAHYTEYGSTRLRFGGDGYISANVKLMITAEFPEEDTVYIEEGFDYCIDVGANLVASPCEQSVPILDTLPSEIANNLTGIIGGGVAATNQDGNWVGSLSGLGGGNGYWMLSNVSACFNYNCVEN